MKKILFFGDSITDAYRNYDDKNDLGKGFAYLLQKKYQQHYFINRGISGHKTSDLLDRFHEVLEEKIDVCFMFIGINDAWHPHLHQYPFDLKTFSKNYELLIQKLLAKQNTFKTYLILPHVFKLNYIDDPTFDDIMLMKQESMKLAKAYGLETLDLKPYLNKEKKTYKENEILADGVHPTPKGYEIMFKAIDAFGMKHHIW